MTGMQKRITMDLANMTCINRNQKAPFRLRANGRRFVMKREAEPAKDERVLNPVGRHNEPRANVNESFKTNCFRRHGDFRQREC